MTFWIEDRNAFFQKLGADLDLLYLRIRGITAKSKPRLPPPAPTARRGKTKQTARKTTCGHAPRRPRRRQGDQQDKAELDLVVRGGKTVFLRSRSDENHDFLEARQQWRNVRRAVDERDFEIEWP